MYENDAQLLAPVRANLYKHQSEAFLFVLNLYGALDGTPPESNGAGLLFEMGCGKTITSIAIAGFMYQMGLVKRLLIVAPLSVLSVWQEEFARFASFPFSLTVLSGPAQRKKQLLRTVTTDRLDVKVINYESAWRLKPELLAYNADMIIGDELHKTKDGQTAQSKGMHELGDKARYKLGLTGTLITGSEIDVWSQFRFMNPDIFGKSFYRFRNRYFWMGGFEQHVPYFRKETGGEFLSLMHSITYRITKAEALDLPETTEEIRTVDLEPEAMKLYTQLRNASYAELMNSEVTAANILTRLLRLSQICGGHVTDDDGTTRCVSTAKLEALGDILDSAQAGGQKIVVMARFTAELDAIEDLLNKKKIGYGVIRGGVKNRDEEIRRFQNDPDCMVFVGQIQAAGVGITLTAASTMVFFSLDYSMANHTQAMARIHRVGQRNACTYIYLCARNTVDGKVIQALQNKQNLARALIDDYRAGINPFA